MDGERHTLGAALRALALLDSDGARERNDVGFNGADTELGNKLARIPEERLSPKQARYAWSMLRKYKNTQLAAAGIDYDRIPVPPEWTPALQAEYERRRETWRANVAPFPRELALDNGRLFFRFPFDQAHVAEIKHTLPVRWDKLARVWHMPLPATAEECRKVGAFAGRHGYNVDTAAAAALAAIIERAEAFRVASRAADTTFEITGLRRTLYPFQRAGVEYAVKARRVLIGDEMGLGKTTQAIAAVHYLGAYPCLVVTTAATKYNWRREWLATVQRQPLNVDVLGSKAFNTAASDVVVVNYDLLRKHHGELLSRGFKAIVVDESHYCKNPDAQRTKLVYTLATGKVKRKNTSPEIVGAGIDVRILLTGTPIVNRPQELISQLDILGWLEAFGGAWRFKNSYCMAVQNSFGTQYVGAKDTDKLNSKLRSMCYVRREKKQVVSELPPIQRTPVELALDNAAEYRKAERDVIEFIRQAAKNDRDFLASLADLNDEEREAARKEYADDKARKAARAETLVRMNTLKQVAARGILAGIKEWVESFLEQEGKLIVFAHHLEVQRALLDCFPGALRIFGEDDAQARDEAAQRFQNDPAAKLIVCSLSAAREGVTLTAASNVAFVELGWTPAAHDQAEARCYGRINDLHGANAWYFVAQGTIYETIAALIEQKRATVEAVTNGAAEGYTSEEVAAKGAANYGKSIVGDVARALARKGKVEA